MVLTDQEPSIDVSSKLTQPRAEYMNLKEIRKDKNKTQGAYQDTDDAALHPSTLLLGGGKGSPENRKIIGKVAFGRVAKETAVELRGRSGTTTIVAIKMLKGKALFRLYFPLGKTPK